MDKGLEKINILKNNLNDVIKKIDIIDKELEEKQLELSLEYQGLDKLNKTNEDIASQKEEIEFCMKNIKKAKRNKFIFTIGMIIILELLLILTPKLMFPSNITKISKILMIYYNIYIIPLSIIFGDVNDYRGKKKYLKKHKLEDVEKQLIENKNQIDLSQKQINVLEENIDVLTKDLDELMLEEEIITKEIEKISLIRKDIIESFIDNNQELDNLLNNGYDMYINGQNNGKLLIKE